MTTDLFLWTLYYLLVVILEDSYSSCNKIWKVLKEHMLFLSPFLLRGICTSAKYKYSM